MERRRFAAGEASLKPVLNTQIWDTVEVVRIARYQGGPNCDRSRGDHDIAVSDRRAFSGKGTGDCSEVPRAYLIERNNVNGGDERIDPPVEFARFTLVGSKSELRDRNCTDAQL
jgi:hypothetical protein